MKYVKLFSSIGLLFILFLNISAQEKPVQTKNDKPATVVASPTQTERRDENVQPQEMSADNNNFRTSIAKADERYRIGFQDTVEISVFKHPELSQTVSINPDGTITLPRIDRPIVAVCKTERELKDTITSLYKGSYLRDPFVNVRVTDQRSQPFAVVGAVNKPGSFFLNQRIRLVQLIALAGGQDVEQSAAKVKVARTGNRLGCVEAGQAEDDLNDVQFMSYDLRDVLSGRENPWMQPGDIVSVQEAEQAYVVGDIFKPTKVDLKGTVTLSTAIAAAGGLGSNAKSSTVVIQRQKEGTPIREELVFNMKDIDDKKVPDPILQANDIVTVPTDKIKAVKSGLLKALTGGLGNIFYRFP